MKLDQQQVTHGASSPQSSMFFTYFNWSFGFIALMALLAGVGAIYVGLVDHISVDLLGVEVNAAVLGGFLLLEALVLGVVASIGLLRITQALRLMCAEKSSESGA